MPDGFRHVKGLVTQSLFAQLTRYKRDHGIRNWETVLEQALKQWLSAQRSKTHDTLPPGADQ
jgi:hypothetical protein